MNTSINKLKTVMSAKYWECWNNQVQARIDNDIEKNRKADAFVVFDDLPEGTEIKVEQISHSFVFGAHIFNFDQLGANELNTKYKDLYGTLFNSATIAFYWKKFELEEGKPRFKQEFRDTAEFWNNVKNPKEQPHWRRPATDPVVEFCEKKGIRLHGHTLVWGNPLWHYPEWFFRKLPWPYGQKFTEDFNDCIGPSVEMFSEFTPSQIEQMFPEFSRELHNQMMKRIVDIALYYKGRLHSWDVVNESSTDNGRGNLPEEDGICKSWYGLMPGDYPYRSLKIAESMFPSNVLLNINDYNMEQAYPDQVKRLIERGCKIDVMGAQMHLFDPKQCLDIAEGNSDEQSPQKVWETMDRLGQAGRPIHLSEVTISAPGNDEKGQAIQAVMIRNLYRLWFSIEKMMGITWWNVVDDCGAPGEPSVSGIFNRDMQPKPAYHVMNDLINNEWKTKLTTQTDKNRNISFRGFKGTYKLSWISKSGMQEEKTISVL